MENPVFGMDFCNYFNNYEPVCTVFSIGMRRIQFSAKLYFKNPFCKIFVNI